MPDHSEMMFFVSSEVWTITNYSVFRAALQMPLSRVKVSTYNKNNIIGYYLPVGVNPNYNVPKINHNFN
jgi:hypothetical protein